YTGGAPGGSVAKSNPITGRQYASGPLPRIATVNSGPGRYVSTSTGSAYRSTRNRTRSRSAAGPSHRLLLNTPLPDPSATGFTNTGNGSASRSTSSGVSRHANGAVGTPRKASVSLVRPLCSDSASVRGSEPVEGMLRYSQIAGPSASRFW